MKQNSYLNAVQSARALLDSIKPAKAPRYDAMTNIALVSMEDIHRSACERICTESRRILKALHALKAGQRKILSFVSDDPATYEERDGRRVSKARERMVALAVAAIRDGAEGAETAIAHRFFSRFRDLPDAYDNFESFMRQVRRTMSA